MPGGAAAARRRSVIAARTWSSSCSSRVSSAGWLPGRAWLAGAGRATSFHAAGAGPAAGAGRSAGAVPSGGSEVADSAGGMVSSCISGAVPGGWPVPLTRLGPGVAVPGVMPGVAVLPVAGVPAGSACGRGAVAGGCPCLAAGCAMSPGLSSSARV